MQDRQITWNKIRNLDRNSETYVQNVAFVMYLLYFQVSFLIYI